MECGLVFTMEEAGILRATESEVLVVSSRPNSLCDWKSLGRLAFLSPGARLLLSSAAIMSAENLFSFDPWSW